MRVFGWAANDGGSFWYRMAEPARVLRMLGHEVRLCEVALSSWVQAADVIVGQGVAKDGPSARWREWADAGRFLVYDVDDDLSVVDRESREAYAFYSQRDVQRRLGENMRMAARVTAASERIAEWASKFNADVRVVPNGLPAEVLGWERKPRDNGRVTVGWVGSQQSLPELKLAARALVRAADTLPVRLRTIGVPRWALRPFGLDRPGVEVTEWTRAGLDYLSTVDFDVWVAPYRRIPFNVAKFPTKSLEAAMLGIPLVASDIPPYRQSVVHGRTGFLVGQDHEWGRYVRRLVEDGELRRAMGEAARARAGAWTGEGYGARWVEALTP